MADQTEIPRSFPGGRDVAGKRVVITGASRGLGRLLAHAFSQGGARVALAARTETDLKAVAAELPGPSLVLSGDVTDGEFNEAVAERWKKSPELGAAVLGHTAQRRWGASTDLAGAYQFLASDASAFVTGTVLNVDGGYLLV
jgi:NAD(P)-dependent dehydrogenase (short-subunit alcohol dehydrogenase family)